MEMESIINNSENFMVFHFFCKIGLLNFRKHYFKMKGHGKGRKTVRQWFDQRDR